MNETRTRLHAAALAAGFDETKAASVADGWTKVFAALDVQDEDVPHLIDAAMATRGRQAR